MTRAKGSPRKPAGSKPKPPKSKAAPKAKPRLKSAAAKKRKPAPKPAKTVARNAADAELLRARSFLRAIGELGKRIHPLMTESELLGRFEMAVEQLFPDAAWVVRTVDRKTGQFTLRLSQRLPGEPSGQVQPGQTAGSLALRDGKVTSHAAHPLSETAPGGFSTVFPLQVALEQIGYFDISLHAADEEGHQIAEMLAGQFAVSLRTLHSADEARNLKKYLSSVVDNANSILMIVAPTGRIKFFNRYAEQLSGYAREELIGKNLLRVFRFHTGDRNALRRTFSDALVGRPIINFEARYLAKGDEVRYALFNSAPILDVKGHITDVIITGIDLTEAKQLERQIVHTEKLASLGEMAAGVVHELNNPLTSIYANAELQIAYAKRAGREESEIRRLTTIMEGAERIRTLVRNLMGYVRPAEEEMAAVDMNRVLEQALGFCNYELTKAGVILRRELQSDLPLIRGLSGQLQQVLVNLITNACHAVMEKGSGSITVRSYVEKARVAVEVQDTGVGINEEDLAKIHLPFFTTKREGVGTGLGLSIVMRILEKHQAQLRIDSKRSVGSSFSVLLPLPSEENPEGA